MKYKDFISEKQITHKPCGFEVDGFNPIMKPFQQACTRWALLKGRASLFEGTGLGKTIQSLEWAKHVHKHTNKPVLIVAPLAVSKQTKREGEKFGYDVNICKTGDDLKNMINITNYQRVHHFNPSEINGVVLDESGILKSIAGKTRNMLIDMFARVPYKLCATATPSPNDYTELGGTSHFLNVMTRPEMLSMFFINDTGDTGTWRLKGHVAKNKFWDFVASWALMFQSPYDIGFDGSEYELPDLVYHDHVIPFTGKYDGLFVENAQTLTERNDARRESLVERCEKTAELINGSNESWVAWCNLNPEGSLLKKLINDSVEVCGSDSDEHKEQAMIDFQDGKIKCLITKPKIAGHGMNWQNCHNTAFTGLSDSFEQLYQAIRRFWRFGQTERVNCHIITGQREGLVVQNIKRKEKDMENMLLGMIECMRDIMKSDILKTTRNVDYYAASKIMTLPNFLK